jgi:shikimate O-hydroxycinnamoyltransferase
VKNHPFVSFPYLLEGKKKMEVEIISKECIKRSSPTPPNLRTHKLSLLDQIDAAAHFPLIVFYPMNQSTSHAAVDIFFQRSQMLKQSLSKVLTCFYVFAGTIKDNLSIDCNDKGVYYLEARVNCRLVDCLSQPNLPSFEKFIPRDYTWKETGAGDDHVAMIKVTSCTCGGMAIGILVSHMIADGTSLNIFLKGWAAMARKACDETLCIS